MPPKTTACCTSQMTKKKFENFRPTKAPIAHPSGNLEFGSDVDAPTSVNNITQNLKNVNPSGKNITRTSGQCASATTFHCRRCRVQQCCRLLNSLKASAITEALLRYFFNTQDNASFTLHIQYMRHGGFCQYLFAKNRPRFCRFVKHLLHFCC